MPAAGMPASPAISSARCGLRAAAGIAAAVLLAACAWGASAADEVAYEVVGESIPVPLTGVPGDPVRGRDIVRDIRNATCLICHAMPIPEEPDHGDIGPPLAGVGSRYSAGELRLRLVNPKLLNTDTVMPAYFSTDNLNRVQAAWRGKTIYTAQEIEDVVAYLTTLQEE
jgi:L-cysteine S-thiosulfotransferase